MFYSNSLFPSKTELGNVWLAGNWNDMKKLKKTDIDGTNVEEVAKSILDQQTNPFALRVLSSLLMGLTRIYYRKVEYLYFDSGNALFSIKDKAALINHQKGIAAKRGSNASKHDSIVKKISFAQLSASFHSQKSSEEDELIMRSSKQKMARDEDITLPEESILPPSKRILLEEQLDASQSDPLVPINEEGFDEDNAADYFFHDGTDVQDTSVEIARNAMQSPGPDVDLSIIDDASLIIQEGARLREEAEEAFSPIKLGKMAESAIDKSLANENCGKADKNVKKMRLRIDKVTKLKKIKFGSHESKGEINERNFVGSDAFYYDIGKPMLFSSSPKRSKITNLSTTPMMLPPEFLLDSSDPQNLFSQSNTFASSPRASANSDQLFEEHFLDLSDPVLDNTDAKIFTGSSPEASRSFEKSSHSEEAPSTKNSEKVLQRLKGLDKNNISFRQLSESCSRRDTAKLFYEVLSLKTTGLISCEQKDFFEDILLSVVAD